MMNEITLEKIRHQFEKGEYFTAIEIINSIPESSKKTEIELWAFVFMPVSHKFHEFISEAYIKKKLNIDTNPSYLSILTQLVYSSILLEDLVLFFESDGFSKLGKTFLTIEQQYAKLYSEANSPESKFLLDEVYLYFLYYKARSTWHFEKKYEIALELYLTGLTKAQQLHSNLLIYRFYFELEYFYQTKGELNQGIEYALRRLEFVNKLENQYWKIYACNSLGNLYSFQGNKEESLKYIKLGLSFLEDSDDILSIKFTLMFLDSLGQTQIEFGLLSEGHKNLEQCKIKLEYYLKSNKINKNYFSWFIPDILMGLFNYWFSLNDDEQCQAILSEFSTIPTKLSDLNLNKYKLSKARYLLKKGRIHDKSMAFSLLKEIMNSTAYAFDVTFPTLILLTQLLLEDYENTNDQTIILEINSYIENLSSATESVQISINLAILNSKIKLLEGNIDEAEEILVENLNLSEKFGYYYNEQTILGELAKFREEKTRWKELLLKGSNDLKKLQLEDFKCYLDEAKSVISYK